MEKKIKEICEKLPKIHHNLGLFAHHLLQSINHYKEQRIHEHYEDPKNQGTLKNTFYVSIHQCQHIVIDELTRVSEHIDEIESRYEEIQNLQRIQEFKKAVPESHKDIAIFVQELIKRFDDLKLDRLSHIGMNLINGKEVDPDSEKLFHEVVDEVEELIMVELEKTLEDIKNIGKPGYLKHYRDGIK